MNKTLKTLLIGAIVLLSHTVSALEVKSLGDATITDVFIETPQEGHAGMVLLKLDKQPEPIVNHCREGVYLDFTSLNKDHLERIYAAALTAKTSKEKVEVSYIKDLVYKKPNTNEHYCKIIALALR